MCTDFGLRDDGVWGVGAPQSKARVLGGDSLPGEVENQKMVFEAKGQVRTIGPRASAERRVELGFWGEGGEGGVNPEFPSRRPPKTFPSHNSAGLVPLRTKARTYRI